MTISIFLGLMNGVLITAVLIFFFRSLNLQSKMDALHFRRLNEMNDLYKQRFEAMEDEIANLRNKHEALPCWKKVETNKATDSKVVDDDAPRRSIHVVSISNGGSFGDILGQMFAGAAPPELVAARRLFSVVESDKPTAAELKAAMASVTDREVLDTALQGLIEGERYELAQIVKDEIASRNTQKTTK